MGFLNSRRSDGIKPSRCVGASFGRCKCARRGRSSDLVYEIQLQRHLHRLGLLTSFEVLRNLVVRGGNMLRTFIRGLVYRRFLRKKCLKVRVLITGGSGFVGSNLISDLRNSGIDVKFRCASKPMA